MKRALWVFSILMSSTLAMAQTPAVPATPAGIDELVLARPFTLEEGFRFDWRSEKPTVTQGVLMVVQVNPDLVYPRQTAEPILYVGDQTAMRLNVGYPSGRVVAIVPGAALAGGNTRIWFGTPGLPEQVTAATIAGEQQLADAAGIGSLSAEEVDIALQRGGGPVRSSDLDTLLDGAAELVGR